MTTFTVSKKRDIEFYGNTLSVNDCYKYFSVEPLGSKWHCVVAWVEEPYLSDNSFHPGRTSNSPFPSETVGVITDLQDDWKEIPVVHIP